ncbi:MAG: AarF/ABC1/UbiB kinase family protein [Pseudomonadota bacterium]
MTMFDDTVGGRTVPASQIARLTRLGALASGVAGSAAAEGFRSLARGERPAVRDLLLTPGNARRVADQLARMRGAAMKVGQLLSMETGELLPSEMTEILARLRSEAEFMPPRQLKSVLSANWGSDFVRRFERFDVRPIAAASIGQVHRARSRDGRDLAIKVQYPGVRRSIESDVDNVAALVRMTGLLPSGLDLAPLLAEAKAQLHEEADYNREAACLIRFGTLLRDAPEFVVPGCAPDLTTDSILAMDFAPGHAVEDVTLAEQAVRDRVATVLIDLVLRELFEFGLMQTDPNFANYRYDSASRRIVLLDFGATREVSLAVSEGYALMLRAGLADDQDGMTSAAHTLGLFDETTAPHHVAAMVEMTARVCAQFRAAGPYDFGRSTLPQDLRDAGLDLALDQSFTHIPPMDTLFVQRKLAGVFLLATRLRARVDLHGLLAARLPPAAV